MKNVGQAERWVAISEPRHFKPQSCLLNRKLGGIAGTSSAPAKSRNNSLRRCHDPRGMCVSCIYIYIYILYHIRRRCRRHRPYGGNLICAHTDPLGPRLVNGLAGPDAVVAMAANAAAGAAEAATTEAGAAATGAAISVHSLSKRVGTWRPESLNTCRHSASTVSQNV
jgi:hypothetical protein